MPSIQWSLKTFETRQSFQGPAIKVEIDPWFIAGSLGIFGPVLYLPYTLPKPDEDSASMRLLSLGGWLGYGNVSDTGPRLHIPSQNIWPDNRSRLQVSLTHAQIEAIEEARNGNQLGFTVWLEGLASIGQAVVPVRSTNSGYLSIDRERWLTVLRDVGAGTRRLVELPEPRLPRGMDVWAECLRLLDGATGFHQSGLYEQVLINCRKIAEGIPQVICDVWGVPQKTDHQSVGEWLRTTVVSQLTAAWPEDRKSPVMIRTLLSGVWEWAAPAPHYGTEMPLREKAAFGLELCTSLLHFAGQVLEAHPDPIIRQQEETG